MNTRFYNARILDKDFQIIQGELHVVGNRIAYIGPEKTQDAYGENAWDREIDVKENLLIPVGSLLTLICIFILSRSQRQV